MVTVDYRSIIKMLEKNNITDPLLDAAFLAQIEVETGFVIKSENLNYSDVALRTLFPKYFNEKTAAEFGRTSLHPANKQGIANIIYGNRMGNDEPGDGYKFRGRGLLQITGKDNYKKLSADFGIDLIANPELLLSEPFAICSAIWYWRSNNLTEVFKQHGIDGISKMVNAGNLNIKIEKVFHYKERRIAFEKYKKLLTA